MSRRHPLIKFRLIPTGIEKLERMFSTQRTTAMNKIVADAMVLNLAKYIYERSKTRHKSADRLHAPHTGTLEFSRTNPSHTRRGGSIFARVVGKTAEVVIQGVAGISRAFHALDIYPRRARALTIPAATESYAKTAATMEANGWKLFVPKRRMNSVGNVVNGALWGTRGGVTKPLFWLRKHTHIPKDTYLLPDGNKVSKWAADAYRREIDRMMRRVAA